MYNPYIKRFLDFMLAIGGLLILSPVLIAIIIVLLIVNNGKPFFLQARPGKNGRVTKAGAFIRKYSLDELLQLVNVLKGDMSLIGPRPLLIQYLPLYNKEQQKRHDVRPGITGWAQIKGRNSISWNQKFEYDDGEITMEVWSGNDS